LPVKLVEQLNKECLKAKEPVRSGSNRIQISGSTMTARNKPKGNKLDLTHVFVNPDLDVAQSHFDALPQEAHDYLERVFIYKAGLGPKPAPYSGPPVSDPTDPDQDDG
jgi:hypothetical protein